MGRSLCFLLSSLALTTTFSFLLMYSPNPLNPFPRKNASDDKSHFLNKPKKEEEKNSCDIFKGQWMLDTKNREELQPYTNSRCKTIPESKNCFRNGRRDRDFLNWRWKPDKCELPRFDAKAFLGIVRGKTMAFVGDSVSRNHFESLLCLLSLEEVPSNAFKDPEDRNRIWYFSEHDFTLKILWTKFLIDGKERVVNGTNSGIYDLNLDKIDENWSKGIHDVDYIIISDAHWFFRPIYLHKGYNIVACVYCNDPNVTDQGVSFAVRLAFRAAFSHINHCKKCQVVKTLLRTFSPSHFEGGFWNSGGTCNRTSPSADQDINLESNEWKIRTVQVEEIEMARKKDKKGKFFAVVDITRAMLMRPDGHPGAFWGNKWMKGYNDCVHWCLPGPIDTWNDFLLGVLSRLG